MNIDENFKIRLDSYEFYLDECVKYERRLQRLSDSLELSLEELNIGTAKKISKKGLKLCEKLESLYLKLNVECESFATFLENNEIKDDDSFFLVGEQVRQAQKNVGDAVEEHKQLFCDIIKN